jgi:preprotein translocase subunit SecE
VLKHIETVVHRAVQDRTGDSAFSEAELARLAAIKQSKSSVDPEGGMIQGALSEVNLIDWPAPAKAAVETVYVLLIVVGASAFLFALNGLFTEVANKLY